MKKTLLPLVSILFVALAPAHAQDSMAIRAAIDNTSRTEANRERDGERKPEQVLAFMGLEPGDVVLDWGSGGGYWAELFAGEVGKSGRVYAHQSAGERFDARKDALMAQYKPFGNVMLLPVAQGAAIPLEDDSVDAVMLSYIFHHMHYAEGAGDALPEGSALIIKEFLRVLKPGGEFVVIEHVAADGSSRAQSASWHRTPPKTAKADITGLGFEFAGEAPGIFMNPDDDRMNNWNETGLRGHTTSFVHKYRKPD